MEHNVNTVKCFFNCFRIGNITNYRQDWFCLFVSCKTEEKYYYYRADVFPTRPRRPGRYDECACAKIAFPLNILVNIKNWRFCICEKKNGFDATQCYVLILMRRLILLFQNRGRCRTEREREKAQFSYSFAKHHPSSFPAIVLTQFVFIRHQIKNSNLFNVIVKLLQMLNNMLAQKSTSTCQLQSIERNI